MFLGSLCQCSVIHKGNKCFLIFRRNLQCIRCYTWPLVLSLATTEMSMVTSNSIVLCLFWHMCNRWKAVSNLTRVDNMIQVFIFQVFSFFVMILLFLSSGTSKYNLSITYRKRYFLTVFFYCEMKNHQGSFHHNKVHTLKR